MKYVWRANRVVLICLICRLLKDFSEMARCATAMSLDDEGLGRDKDGILIVSWQVSRNSQTDARHSEVAKWPHAANDLLRAKSVYATSNCKHSMLNWRRLEDGLVESQNEISYEIDSRICTNSSVLNPMPPKAGAIGISLIGKFLLVFVRGRRLRWNFRSTLIFCETWRGGAMHLIAGHQ